MGNHAAHHHAYPLADPLVATTSRGIRTVQASLAVLAAVAVVQSAIVALSGSVGLLADAIHNLADAATAIPLWIAFRLAQRKPDGRFTYGYGRVEDLAGVVVVGVILAGAAVAGVEAIRRLADPAPVGHPWAVAAAAVIGIAGNEAVAVYRVRTGEAIGSAALVADGRHARADGLASLAVLLGAAGSGAGYPAADPIAGLLVTAYILNIVREAGRDVFLRLLDGADPAVTDRIRQTTAGTPGVADVSNIRVRWAGHRMYAEVDLAVDGTLTVSEGHAIAAEAKHRLLHALPQLSDATIHVDPADGTRPAAVAPEPTSRRHAPDARAGDREPRG